MSHKSNKSAKAALGRAVGSEKGKSNKHITRISAKPSTERENANQSPKTAPEAVKNLDRPDTAVSDQNAAKASEKTPDGTNTNENALKKTNKKALKADKKAAKRANKNSNKHTKGAEKPLKEVFILARPFVALGRYIRDSWREIRRVRWPNRKATWKMTGAVLAYCVAFMVFIVLLDSFFTWLFSLIIK